MPATEPSKSDRLKEGLARIRASLTARGEPITPDDSNPIHELSEYHGQAIFRFGCTLGTAKEKGRLSKEDTDRLVDDMFLVNQIFGLVHLQLLED